MSQLTKEQLIEIFDQWNYSDFKLWYETYKSALPPERVEPSIIYPDKKDSLIVDEVRCNKEVDFNDRNQWNDLLFVIEITDNERSIVLHQFDCTTDPCSKKYNIAHTARQIYRGNTGYHRGDHNRICIRSDEGFGTWIRRTDSKGVPIKNGNRVDAYSDHIGINIHDMRGNTSLGCTGINNMNKYETIFKPLLNKCSNKNNIPVMLHDIDDIHDLLQPAKSVDGKDMVSQSTAQPE